MTPTLFGRWQSRLFLFPTFGLIATIPFVVGLGSFQPLILLFFAFIIGCLLDLVYSRFQTRFWDHDWPAVMQLVSGILEFFILFILIYLIGLGRPFGPPPNLFVFGLHYAAVWTTIFIASQSFMRIFFPRWRYSGGQWLK